MSSKNDIEKEFKKAYQKASRLEKKIPPDLKLKLYAYYKQATKGDNTYLLEKSDVNIVNAFKLNAWIQIKGMNEEEAKKNYIELINKILKQPNYENDL